MSSKILEKATVVSIFETLKPIKLVFYVMLAPQPLCHNFPNCLLPEPFTMVHLVYS